MKNGKLRALALLLALAALLALGAFVYPLLTRSAQEQEARARATAAPTATAELETTAEPEATAAPDATAEPEATAEPAQTDKPSETVAPEPEELYGPVQKTFAPDFTYYDEDGVAAKLSALRGTPVIVNCFASWCGPCRGEMPHFDAAIDEYDGRIRFLMLDINAFGNDKAEDALAMVEELGLTFDVVFDTDGEAAGAYGIRAFPTTLFIASDGELVDTQIGAMTREMLSQGIERLLAAEE